MRRTRRNRIGLHRGDVARGLDDSRRAISTLEPLIARQPDRATMTSLAMSYDSLADALEHRRDYREALVYRKKEANLFERLAAANPKDLNVQRNLALGYKYLGGILEAVGDVAQATPTTTS